MYLAEAVSTERHRGAVGQLAPVAAPPALGTFARAEYEAQQIVANEAAAWTLAGSLISNGLYRLQIQHPGAGVNNQFRRYSFQGADKCNLFALDVAWRSGFHVPVLNIGTAAQPRYSYPLANTLTSYAERAVVGGQPRLLGVGGQPWGAPQTQVPSAILNVAIRRLGTLLVVVGWRRRGTGHAGIIRSIRDVTYSTNRRITSITYDGWEATAGGGARNLVQRRWRTANCGPLTGVCQNNPPGGLMNVFCRIHIISLLPEQSPFNRGIETSFVNRCQL